ncbi:ATP-binding cassette domain-containing protein [Arthrobacter sp. TMN-49]
MTQTSLQLESVTRRYGDHVVLRDFNLHVNAGEMVALTGPSGSGKSTVLNLVGLLEAPDAGSVSLAQRPAPAPGSKAALLLRRHTLGYLFQNYALIDGATVAENLRVAMAYTKPGTSAADAIGAALEQVGLPGTQKRRVHTLSGGEQQRVAIARLLLKSCDIVIADEPTGSLDGDSAASVLDQLQMLADAGKAILLATHDPLVAGRCSRIASLG